MVNLPIYLGFSERVQIFWLNLPIYLSSILCAIRFELWVVILFTPEGGVAVHVLVVGVFTVGWVTGDIVLQACVRGVSQSIKLVFESIGLLLDW